MSDERRRRNPSSIPWGTASQPKPIETLGGGGDLSGELAAAVGAIRAVAGDAAPSIGLILGSGLGGFAERLDEQVVVPYGDIPGFAASTVPGHAGRLVLGRRGAITCAVMQGRIHFYEGHSARQVAFPARTLVALGARTLIVTNAARGGLRPRPDPDAIRDLHQPVPRSPAARAQRRPRRPALSRHDPRLSRRSCARWRAKWRAGSPSSSPRASTPARAGRRTRPRPRSRCSRRWEPTRPAFSRASWASVACFPMKLGTSTSFGPSEMVSVTAPPLVRLPEAGSWATTEPLGTFRSLTRSGATTAFSPAASRALTAASCSWPRTSGTGWAVDP